MTKFIKLLLSIAAFCSVADAATVADKAIKLSLSQGDFQELSMGLSDSFKNKPIAGRLEEPIRKETSKADLEISGISYELNIDGISLSSFQGKFLASVQVSSYKFQIEKLAVDHAWMSTCSNIEVLQAAV